MGRRRSGRRKQILQLVEQGLTDREIAEKLGIKKSTVTSYRKTLGIYTKRGERIIRSRKIIAENIDDIVRMYDDGKSMKEIAKTFDVSPIAIRNALKRAGAKIRPRWWRIKEAVKRKQEKARAERQKIKDEIMEVLSERGALLMTELKKIFNITEYKFKRALRELENEGKVKLVYIRFGTGRKRFKDWNTRLAVYDGIVGKSKIIYSDNQGLLKFLKNRMTVGPYSSPSIKRSVRQILKKCGVPKEVIDKLLGVERKEKYELILLGETGGHHGILGKTVKELLEKLNKLAPHFHGYWKIKNLETGKIIRSGYL